MIRAWVLVCCLIGCFDVTAGARIRDPLIPKLFRLTEARWKFLHLNSLAKKEFRSDKPNPLLDPQKCGRWLRKLHREREVDFSYGGYLEDRKDLWRDHYHQPGQTVHLGIDYNVPEGTDVYAPIDSVVVDVFRDNDARGGWGGRVILKNSAGLYLVLAHLDPSDLPTEGEALKAGARLGRVGSELVNGGWFPHLHVQTLTEFKISFDGYAARGSDLRSQFPHPKYFIFN